MKRSWMFLVVLLSVTGMGTARAQVSAYGEFSASNLAGGPQGDYLFGASGGVLLQGPTIFKRVIVSADLDGRFVGKNGERLDGVTVGPRFSLSPVYKKIAPFVGFNVGFARYNNGANNSTTDNIFGGQGGVTRQISPRLDIVLDYRYDYYGYNFNVYSPSTYSGGVVYHFTKR